MRQIRKKYLRVFSVCVAICMLVSLYACGGSKKDAVAETAAKTSEPAVTQTSETPAQAAETAVTKTVETSAAEEETTAVEAAAEDTGAADADTAVEAAAEDTGAADADTAAEAAAEETETGLTPDYSREENWAYFAIGENKDVDLFLVCPTVDTKDEYNMSMDDEDVRKSFFGALNMERGIYEDRTRMFAPYYRQVAMKTYDLDPEDREQYLEKAYGDVSAAFSWYMENENGGRPLVLAGFSQGADMCYRLMKEYFGDSNLQKQLVAVYGIGWPLTEKTITESPWIVPAAAENDTGVVISFDCESEELTESFINPAGQRAISINPLNWKTDSTPADKSLNAGACFTDYAGGIKQEVAGLCGCYIDEERGVLKVTDVTPKEYPPILAALPEGSYHIFDYQFFFRNLQQNVDLRIDTYLAGLEEK